MDFWQVANAVGYRPSAAGMKLPRRPIDALMSAPHPDLSAPPSAPVAPPRTTADQLMAGMQYLSDQAEHALPTGPLFDVLRHPRESALALRDLPMTLQEDQRVYMDQSRNPAHQNEYALVGRVPDRVDWALSQLPGLLGGVGGAEESLLAREAAPIAPRTMLPELGANSRGLLPRLSAAIGKDADFAAPARPGYFNQNMLPDQLYDQSAPWGVSRTNWPPPHSTSNDAVPHVPIGDDDVIFLDENGYVQIRPPTLGEKIDYRWPQNEQTDPLAENIPPDLPTPQSFSDTGSPADFRRSFPDPRGRSGFTDATAANAPPLPRRSRFANNNDELPPSPLTPQERARANWGISGSPFPEAGRSAEEHGPPLPKQQPVVQPRSLLTPWQQHLQSQGFDVSRPLFHGTTSDFENFTSSPVNDRPGDSSTYLSANPHYSASYADGDGGNIRPVFARGPLFSGSEYAAVRDAFIQKYPRRVLSSINDEIMQSLKLHGYRGIDTGGFDISIFNPEDIAPRFGNASAETQLPQTTNAFASPSEVSDHNPLWTFRDLMGEGGESAPVSLEPPTWENAFTAPLGEVNGKALRTRAVDFARPNVNQRIYGAQHTPLWRDASIYGTQSDVFDRGRAIPFLAGAAGVAGLTGTGLAMGRLIDEYNSPEARQAREQQAYMEAMQAQDVRDTQELLTPQPAGQHGLLARPVRKRGEKR